MYETYHDIRKRLGEPLWHDWHGVPRYEPYRPGMQDVYAKYDALLLIRCQSCGREFRVGACAPNVFLHDDFRKPQLPRPGYAGDFGFGDAPYHEDNYGMCAGATMTTDWVRVMEFWQDGTGGWIRIPEHEVPLDEADGEDDIA